MSGKGFNIRITANITVESILVLYRINSMTKEISNTNTASMDWSTVIQATTLDF